VLGLVALGVGVEHGLAVVGGLDRQRAGGHSGVGPLDGLAVLVSGVGAHG
jgi:hypothetical protein